MAPIPSSAKALARLLTGRNRGLGPQCSFVLLERSCRERAGRSERFVQTRWFNFSTQVGNPVSRALGDGGKGRNPSIGSFPCSVQSRWFLSVGDGEEGDVLSKLYEERLVMGYSQEQLFNVVAAVDMYEDFLPWCQCSRILKRNKDGSFDAELEIGFKFLVERYVSHVELKKPTYVKTTALDTGLFDHLINIWEFNPGPIPGTCDLHFLVDFKFQSPLYRQMKSSSVWDMHRCKSSLESLFCYDRSIPEEMIEKPVGLSLIRREIGSNPPCSACQAKGATLCVTCSGSGLYVDSIMESQGIIVKVRCLGCGGSGNIMCSTCGGRGHTVIN